MTRIFLVAMIVAALAWALVAFAGTPPAPYRDPNLTTTNALGGVGRTQGWKVSTNTSDAVDLLASAVIPAAVRDDVTLPAVSTITRFVTVELACTSEDEVDGGPNPDCTIDEGQAACVRLGPNTDDPALSCDSVGTRGGVTGGCYLRALGDICQFTIRPITSCTSYDTCHGPIWAMTSAGGTPLTLAVSVAW